MMHRRLGLAVLVVAVAVALAATACSKKEEGYLTAPTPLPAPDSSAEGAFETAPGGTAAVGTLARPGAVNVKGIIQSISFENHTFVLLTRNNKEIDVRVTLRTLFAASSRPRVKVAFRSLKPGMGVDVVGRIERGVLVARSVVILKVPPRIGT
jgi:hypothetical protein